MIYRLVDYCGYPNMKSTITAADAQACAVTVFLLIDFLHSWLRVYRDTNFSTNSDQSHRKDFNLVKGILIFTAVITALWLENKVRQGWNAEEEKIKRIVSPALS